MSSKNLKTRDRILKSCWQLLEANNKQVRMSDIAHKAEVSRQAVYLHFPNRADLLVATTRYIDEEKDIDGRLAESRASTGVKRLEAYIDAWGNYIPEIYGVARALMAMYSTDTEAAAAWNERMVAVRDGCAATVSALEEAKKLTATLTKKQAIDALWTLLSVQNWEHLTQTCSWSQADYIAHTKRTAHAVLVAM